MVTNFTFASIVKKDLIEKFLTDLNGTSLKCQNICENLPQFYPLVNGIVCDQQMNTLFSKLPHQTATNITRSNTFVRQCVHKHSTITL